MFTKSITYTDYNGITRTEDFHFNLNRAEIAEMELSISGGMSEMLKKIVNTQDMPALIKIFKEFILKAYGVKSTDGKHFEKSEELSRAFSQTEAYVELFMELASNADKAAEFINALIPSGAEMAAQPALSQTTV